MESARSVVSSIRKMIKDKAGNDSLMGKLDVILIGTRGTMEVCRTNMTTVDQMSLQELQQALEALQKKAEYYCTECHWLWTLAFASSFKDEFETLLDDLNTATVRLTAAASGEALKKLEEVKRSIETNRAKLEREHKKTQEKLDSILAHFARLQNCKDVEDAGEIVDILAKEMSKSQDQILTELRLSKAELKVSPAHPPVYVVIDRSVVYNVP